MDELGDDEVEYGSSASQWEKAGLQDPPPPQKKRFGHWKYHPIIKMTKAKTPRFQPLQRHDKCNRLLGGTNVREMGRLKLQRVVVKGGRFEVINGFEEVRCVGVSGDVSSEG